MTAEEKFSIHREPAWRDKANFVINAKLPEEGRFEQLWTRQVCEDTFELCCTRPARPDSSGADRLAAD